MFGHRDFGTGKLWSYTGVLVLVDGYMQQVVQGTEGDGNDTCEVRLYNLLFFFSCNLTSHVDICFP